VSVGAFLYQVQALARRLPDAPYAVNLCRDRYTFLLSLCAVILRGQCNLLPSNRHTATQAQLAGRFGPAYVICDAELPIADTLESIRIRAELDETRTRSELAPIDRQQLAAISFTSGSTGEARANLKTWGALCDGTAINRRFMLDDPQMACDLLATVPGQHMYGLELSVLMPLMADVCVHDGQPLFPVDVLESLERMQSPRALVSTPLHLRALVESGLSFPPVHTIYSATAPLAKSLATEVEKLFGGAVCEIYGCSEVGSLASRRTAHQDHYDAFDGFAFEPTERGTRVHVDHLPDPVELGDVLKFHDERQFALEGRLTDIVNVAGKRGSLSLFSQILSDTSGVDEAVVFQPDPDHGIGRLAAVVVAPGLTRKDVLRELEQKVDPAFMPRPVVFVDKLPRSETGKPVRAGLLACVQKSRGSS